MSSAPFSLLCKIYFLLVLSLNVSALSISSKGNNDVHKLFVASRSEILNLLNHPLQLQLTTGDLPLGSFRRLVADRSVILKGLQTACLSTSLPTLLDDELSRETSDSKLWLQTAEKSGKTILVPGIKCYTCGGDHLNIDCPDDAEISSSANALASVLEMNGLAGVSAVLRSHGFCCSRLIDAVNMLGADNDCRSDAYMGWLESHADRWTRLADICDTELVSRNENIDIISPSYSICLSMFYGWLDSEAATTGIRLENGQESESKLQQLMDVLEVLEPGYASQRDKHSSFVADVTGSKEQKAKADSAERKVNAAAAYLAAKKKNSKM